MAESFYQYWGKCRQNADNSSYHLLAYHNLDVAACLLRLNDSYLIHLIILLRLLL